MFFFRAKRMVAFYSIGPGCFLVVLELEFCFCSTVEEALHYLGKVGTYAYHSSQKKKKAT